MASSSPGASSCSPGRGLARFAAAIRARAAETGADPDKGALAFEQAPVAVAVVASPKPSEKIPAIEQTLSAGARGAQPAERRAGLGMGRGLADRLAGLRPRR